MMHKNYFLLIAAISGSPEIKKFSFSITTLAEIDSLIGFKTQHRTKKEWL